MICLLAPVPLVHLEAASSCAVFGTRALDVMAAIDARGGTDLPVMFYASHTEDTPIPAATWIASFDSWMTAVGNGGVPSTWRRERPISMIDEDRAGGWWYAFYRVTNLRRAPGSGVVPFSVMRSAVTAKRISDSFIPEGPILVETISEGNR